jgi:chromosomal replication initiation ATPase DnaA
MTYISPYCIPGIKRQLLPKRVLSSLRSVDIDSMETIRNIIQEYFWIELNKRCRKAEYTVPRFLYFHLCKKYTNYSLKDIGDSIGLDHTTVIHGINTISDLAETDRVIYDLIHDVELLVIKSIS